MKISIITCTYNQKKYLRETIESIQKSITSPLDIEYEHLIYDDGSTDGTPELFVNHTWKNIRYFRSDENKGGPSYGRNFLMEKAEGDYIFMIDHDDLMLQRTLYNFATSAIAHPNTEWFIGDFLRMDNDRRYLIGKDYYGWNFKSIEDMLTAIFKGEHFIQSSVFFKRNIFSEAGGFDTQRPIDQDLDLFVRFLFLNYLPMRVPFITHIHRFHDSNLSNSITTEDHLRLVDSLKEKYSEELAKRKIAL